MGQNSTEVAYGFGQFGSTYLTGDGAKLDLDGATAKYYINAITFTEDTTFQTLGIFLAPSERLILWLYWDHLGIVAL